MPIGKNQRSRNRCLKRPFYLCSFGHRFQRIQAYLGLLVPSGPESKAFWIEVLQDLINRGLKRPLLFITDDFRGLTGVINELFPYAQHQLCLIHLQRNLRAKLPHKAYRKVRSLFARLRVCPDRKEGEKLFADLCQVVKEEYQTWGKSLEEKAPHYLAFLDYPQKYVSTFILPMR